MIGGLPSLASSVAATAVAFRRFTTTPAASTAVSKICRPALYSWCRTAFVNSGDRVEIQPIADSVNDRNWMGVIQPQEENKQDSLSFDLTNSVEWMEYLEHEEGRLNDDGGAGAYDTMRCDVLLKPHSTSPFSESSDQTFSNMSFHPALYNTWGERFHLNRLKNSFLALSNIENNETPTTMDAVSRTEAVSATLHNSIESALQESREVMKCLLTEAMESLPKFDAQDHENKWSPHLSTIDKSTTTELDDDLIYMVRLTLLWSPSKGGQQTQIHGKDDGKRIIVRGHACCSCQPIKLHASPKPIVVTVAAKHHQSHRDHDSSALSQPCAKENDTGNNNQQDDSTKKAMDTSSISPTGLEESATSIDKSLPTRFTSNPQIKVASWCRLRRQMERPETYKPTGVSEVLMVRPKMSRISNSTDLEVLEGLSSNFFVVYRDGTLRTASVGVLHGYVRHLVLKRAQECGLVYDPTLPILLHEATENCWKEAFITSSSRLIIPISKILVPHESHDDARNHLSELWADPVLLNEHNARLDSSGAIPKWQELLSKLHEARKPPVEHVPTGLISHAKPQHGGPSSLRGYDAYASPENAAGATTSGGPFLWPCHNERNGQSTQISSRYLSQEYPRWISSGESQRPNRLVRVAIVGSGPSGCYTAKYLRAAIKKQNQQQSEGEQTILFVDMLERLPLPYGLVRNGVAPDHPEVKIVQHDFDQSLFGTTSNNASIASDALPYENDQGKDDEADADEQTWVNFFGNVHVGTDVSLDELRQLYDVVVLAYGCDSDRTLNIPGGVDDGRGENRRLHGVLSAREFVAWYNGHVDFNHIGDEVHRALNERSSGHGADEDHIVVIGVGNVALDCARILGKTREALMDTDVATNALDVLHNKNRSTDSRKQKRTISIVGRRGHVQGAFTIKELRELTKLKEDGTGPQFSVQLEELDLGMTAASKEELSTQRPKTRIDKLLRKQASETLHAGKDDDSEGAIHLRFLLSPIRFEPDSNDSQRLGQVICERTRLEGEPGRQRVVGTGEFETIKADLALVSIGYKGIAIPGTEQWFDQEQGVMKHDHGLVEAAQLHDGLGGVYVSGWLKRGPSGIIGTNIPDAKDTVASIVRDLHNFKQEQHQRRDHSLRSESSPLWELLQRRNVAPVDWEGVQRIQAVESSPRRKRSSEQPREKLTTREELLKAAGVVN